MKRFWSWLGRILEDKDHPLTRSLGECMRFLSIALVVGVAAAATTYTGVDSFGGGETRSSIIMGLLGAAGAKLLKRG